MRLYNSPVSGNCYKVRLLFAHLGLEYETIDVSVVDRSNRAEVLGELNPALRVPTLVLDDGRPLGESNAILWYLGDGTQYVPDDPYERAQVLRVAILRAVQPRAEHRRRALLACVLGNAGALPGAAAGTDARRLHGARCHGGPSRWATFFVGERYSIADIALYAYTHVADEGDFDLAPYSAIRAWLERVASQPGHVPIDA